LFDYHEKTCLQLIAIYYVSSSLEQTVTYVCKVVCIRMCQGWIF